LITQAGVSLGMSACFPPQPAKTATATTSSILVMKFVFDMSRLLRDTAIGDIRLDQATGHATRQTVPGFTTRNHNTDL
jgi:hypothetical protein